jgi:hypothetical protein
MMAPGRHGDRPAQEHMRKAWIGFGLVSATAAPMVLGVACSDSETVTTPTGTAATGGTGGASSTGGTGGNLFEDAGDAGCVQGEPCGDGGVCAGAGVCCSAASVCGSSCCGDAELCSFGQCVTPGAECVDATECGANEYCEYSLGDPGGTDAGADAGCQGGVVPPTGKCLPRPPECAPNQLPGDPPTCLAPCEFHPTPGPFAPVLAYSWGDPNDPNDNVMMAPVVVQLDDDNCDGKVNERDIPEIVFQTFAGNDYNNASGTSATLHAIAVVNGAVVEKWSSSITGASADVPGYSIAAGNLDGIDGAEIVAPTRDGRVRAYHSDGTEMWLSEPAPGNAFMPSIADMDQDGIKEVVTRYQILNGQNGQPKVAAYNPVYAPNGYSQVVAYDMDGDGALDIVAPGRAYHADGTLIGDTGINADHPAVGDLDNDGTPEVAVVSFLAHSLSVWRVNFGEPGNVEILRQGIDINATLAQNPCCAINPGGSGCLYGGGPPTIADFNGDGVPDVALASGIGYVVFDGAALMNPAVPDADTDLWVNSTQDCSSAMTGSSVFDFNGDGTAEVVYGDELHLHIYDGPTGDVVFEACNTSGTLWEYPLVADVNNDGAAELVVASNSYSGFLCNGLRTTGIRIFADSTGKWVRTRRIWNQHAYHVTNVEENGNIPTFEPSNHLATGLNNFRQNRQPAGEFSAPDLIVSMAPKCTGEYALVARVRNVGEASVPAGVVVGFYDGDPAGGGTFLGQALTTQILYSLGSEDVLWPLAAEPTGPVYAVVDDGAPVHTWQECRTDNNTSAAADPHCGTPR